MTLADILQRNPTFSSLDTGDRQVLERALCVRGYPRGHRFTEQGRRVDAMYLIIDGKVGFSQRGENGKRRPGCKVIRAGEVIGLVSLMDHGPATGTCRALTQVTAASLPRDAFALLLSTHAEIGRHFQRIVALQLAFHLHMDARRAAQAISAHDARTIRMRARRK